MDVSTSVFITLKWVAKFKNKEALFNKIKLL